MILRLSLLMVIMFVVGCTPEPDADQDEFAQMRQNMQARQDKMFSQSVKDLKNRKNKDYVRTTTHSDVIDPEEELRLAQEAEKKRWLAVDIDMDEAEDWKALGLSPKNALRWKKTGLSYNTIAVLIKEDVLPSEAIAFMGKKFEKHPKKFITFAQPLYEFQESCKEVVTQNIPDLQLVTKKCKEYDQLLHFSSISGYLADEFDDNDLALEYISKLRQVDSQKGFVLKLMEKSANDAMIHDDTKQFALLFPILESSPSKEEMFFVKKHQLPLKETKRYKSYKYYEFWVNKEKNEERARVAAIEEQKALKRAKQARLKAESERMKALAYNKMVASECGEPATSEPSTGEKVHIEGEVLYLVGKKGSNIFAYVVRSKHDGKNYLVRDPNSQGKGAVNKQVSWTAVTVGRVASVSLDDDGTASYDHYDASDKEVFPMLKFSAKCAYQSRDIGGGF